MTITWPGEAIEDVDGSVIGMTEPRTEIVFREAPSISDAQRKRLGVPDPHGDDDDGEAQKSREW